MRRTKNPDKIKMTVDGQKDDGCFASWFACKRHVESSKIFARQDPSGEANKHDPGGGERLWANGAFLSVAAVCTAISSVT